MTPLPATEVRRLGDRRRTRRRGATLLAAAAVLAAVAVPVAVLAGGTEQTGTPPIAGTPTPTPTPTEVTGVITYPAPGISVVTQADTAKLAGTTPEFKAFIGALADQLATASAGCPDAFHGVTVQKYSGAGYAIGGVNSCGGYVALWGVHDDKWQEAAGTQDQWDCDSLRFFDIPRSFAGSCGNESGDFGPDDVNGLSLTMTPNQVTTAGGTIGAGGSSTCRNVKVPYEPGLASDQGHGVLSPTLGLAGIFAWPGKLTPEGIGLGSTFADVKKAYPQGRYGIGYWIVPLSGGREYQFQVGPNKPVVEMLLSLHNQDCYG